MLVLIANKTDIDETSRKVTKSEGEAFAKEQGLSFFEVSAKNNVNIKTMIFESVIDLPVLDGIKGDKEKKVLIEELEYENSEFNSNIVPASDSSRINISMHSHIVKEGAGNKGCKC